MAQGGSEPGQRQRQYAAWKEKRQSAEKDFKRRITVYKYRQGDDNNNRILWKQQKLDNWNKERNSIKKVTLTWQEG